MLFVKKFATLLICVVVLSAASTMAAAVPNLINYQGKLTDAAGDAVPDAAYLVKFQIYDAATGGTVLWNSLFQTITTVNGLFSYDIGSNVVLPDLFGSDTIRYLGITVGTDPEISPRTRFTSTGYVFRSQKSDLALDADSLGGLQPSFYLDWGNLTSVPAGFADGVDNVGLDQATADGLYVKKLGDVMTGDLNLQQAGFTRINLDANGGSGINIFKQGSVDQTVRLLGPSVGELQLWDNQNPPIQTVTLSAGSGLLRLKNTSGTTTILLVGSSITGDLSVRVPDDAINSLEILDEPG